MTPRQIWQSAFDTAKAAGKCDFDASKAADRALADAAAWQVVQMDAPPPVRLRRRTPLVVTFQCP